MLVLWLVPAELYNVVSDFQRLTSINWYGACSMLYSKNYAHALRFVVFSSGRISNDFAYIIQRLFTGTEKVIKLRNY